MGQASEHFAAVDNRAIDDAHRSLWINAAGLIHPPNRATMSHIIGNYPPEQWHTRAELYALRRAELLAHSNRRRPPW